MKTVCLLLFLLPFALYGQKNATCNCLQNLDSTIAKTEANYAGFPDKVNVKTKGLYLRSVQALRKKAAAINSAKQCFYLVKQYIRFFDDKHLGFTYRNQDDADKEFIPLSLEKFKNEIKHLPSSSVQGIWVNPDTSLRIGIVKKGASGQYRAVILESKNKDLPAGMVYFSLFPDKRGFRLVQYNVFSSIDLYARQQANLLQLWNFELWGREYPAKMSDAEGKELSLWRNRNNGLDFKKINAQYTYLKIPSFFNNDNKIQSLVEKNDSVIRSTQNLIVDLRGNGGGNTGWIYFLPYFMTGPVKQGNTYLRTSPDNVALKLAEIGPVLKNPVPAELKKYFTDEHMAKLQAVYAELPSTKNPFYPIPGLTIPLDSVTVFPRKIALIVDDLCGSSTEYFLYLSRQSKKTTSYGVNTVGMMDYEGMSTPTPLPYSNFILTIPVSKSGWTDTAPIDQSGFAPDVRLDLPREKWIDYIIEDLEKRK